MMVRSLWTKIPIVSWKWKRLKEQLAHFIRASNAGIINKTNRNIVRKDLFEQRKAIWLAGTDSITNNNTYWIHSTFEMTRTQASSKKLEESA